MEDLTQALNPLVDHPVFDITELKGNDQLALELSLDSWMTSSWTTSKNHRLKTHRRQKCRH